MEQLLLVAHGSRKESSNDQVKALAIKLASKLQVIVKVAFLEFASPSITGALNDAFNLGIGEVSVLPYFLSSGNHVVKDLPREVQQAQTRWPDKKITILPHIGASDAMVNLIAQSVLFTDD